MSNEARDLFSHLRDIGIRPLWVNALGENGLYISSHHLLLVDANASSLVLRSVVASVMEHH